MQRIRAYVPRALSRARARAGNKLDKSGRRLSAGPLLSSPDKREDDVSRTHTYVCVCTYKYVCRYVYCVARVIAILPLLPPPSPPSILSPEILLHGKFASLSR